MRAMCAQISSITILLVTAFIVSCGSESTTPAQKPGTCPPRMLQPCTFNVSQQENGTQCFTDWNCRGDLKCCPGVCFQTCQTPDPICEELKCDIACKFGYAVNDYGCSICSCNPDPCLDVTCNKGHRCEARLLPCLRPPCRPAAVCIEDTVKPGLCPPVIRIELCIIDSYNKSTAQCSSDDQCPCNQKCCPQQCVKPLCEYPVKPGRCIIPIRGCPLGAREPVLCEEDYKCPGDEKCCATSCNGMTCQKPAPVCGPVCDIACEYGHVIDANGCPLCSCNPPPPSTPTPVCGPVCDIACEYGHVIDANGCALCSCNPPPPSAPSTPPSTPK